MLYGESCPLEQETIETITGKGIPIIIHRRNLASPVWIHNGPRHNVKDLLTRQIFFRANTHKRNHVARKLIEAKFKSYFWLIKTPDHPIKKGDNLEKIRSIEAYWSKRYWDEYFSKLGCPQFNRRGCNPVSETLDAVSKFTTSVLLRWINYHHLSPFHGFLHEPTEYPALLYDLFEPYRGYFDKIVFDAAKTVGFDDKDKLLTTSIGEVKEFLNTKTYTGLTRQIVTYHELLHGIVLSLRAYLKGDATDFMVPLPQKPNGGRPPKAGFRLYGRSAGKTDFWDCARLAAVATLGK